MFFSCPHGPREHLFEGFLAVRTYASVFRLRRYSSGLWPPFSAFGDTAMGWHARTYCHIAERLPHSRPYRRRRKKRGGSRKGGSPPPVCPSVATAVTNTDTNTDVQRMYAKLQTAVYLSKSTPTHPKLRQTPFQTIPIISFPNTKKHHGMTTPR